MALITSQVSNLDDIMGFMSSDIHCSNQSFTSLMNQMGNMMC